MSEHTGDEHAIESNITDTPVAPAAAEVPLPQPATPDSEAEPAHIGVDRAALGRKFAERRRSRDDDIAFDGSFAPDELRAGRLTQELADAKHPPPDAERPPEGPDAAESDTAPGRKHRLVVRREEREVDDHELHRLAQIGAAGESYLAETKSLRDEAAALRNMALAPRPDEQVADESAPPTADPLATIVEKLQYGPPEEAADALREVIARAQDPEAARRAIYLHQRELDVGRARNAYEAFVARPENAALLKDRRNELVMQDIYYDEVARDLRALGVPEDAIPKDRERLVEAHRFHRIHGQRVRDTTALLEASRHAFRDWRSDLGAPRARQIAVNLDRGARRAAIPQQPARSAAPQPQAAGRAVPTTRSAAVDTILANRRRNIVT